MHVPSEGALFQIFSLGEDEALPPHGETNSANHVVQGEG